MYVCLCQLFEHQLKKKNVFFYFVTYTIIRHITSREICALHLTHPSAHTLGAVGSRQCGARRAVGDSVPCSRVSPQSWTIPEPRFEPTTSGYKSDTLSIRAIPFYTVYPNVSTIYSSKWRFQNFTTVNCTVISNDFCQLIELSYRVTPPFSLKCYSEGVQQKFDRY